MFQKAAGIFAVLALIITASACSTSKSAGPLSKIVVSPERGQVQIGKSIELVARGYDAKGKMVAINPAWKVNTAAIKFGTLNKNAGDTTIFTGKAKGTVVITVDSKGVSGKSIIEVVKTKTGSGR